MLGAAGGVGRATLALTKEHALGQELLPGTAELLLLDSDPPRDPMPAPACARWLPPTQIRTKAELTALLAEHAIDEVIELAAVGTWDMMTACAEAGASYLTTAYDTWIGTELEDPDDARCMLRARALFAPPDLHSGVHMLCMGMNPGLINVLVARALHELAARSGAAPSLAALDLHTILFTEIDTTEVRGPVEIADARFPCSWCPEGCLDELLEPEAMIIRAGEFATLEHAPHRARYEARCKDDLIHGHLVPHEELVTLSAMYPSVDMGYCYRLAPLAEQALAAFPDRPPEDWEGYRLYPPTHLEDLRGFNRLGVLLCSRSYGELWIGWETAMEAALPYATNATLLQVATGVLIGWQQLREAESGIYLPEELDTEHTLAQAGRVLGPPLVRWDPDTPPRSIDARRVP